MTARSFAALVGVIVIVVGLAGLLWGLTISEPAPFGSSRSVDCGSALMIEPMDGSSKLGGKHGERLTEKCSDEALTRRVIFWPIAGVGAVVLAGSLLIRRGTAATAPAGKPTT